MNVGMYTDKDESNILLLKNHPLPVVIYGAGEVALHVATLLRGGGIPDNDIAFAVTNPSDVQDPLGGGHIVYGEKEVDDVFDSYYLVLGWLGAYALDEVAFLTKFSNAKAVLGFSEIYYETERIDLPFFETNRCGFEAFFSILSDDCSKASLEAYLNAKINRDHTFLRGTVELPQYFSGVDSFFPLSSEESFVNCGAYNGDTIRDFLQAVHGNYQKIYAIEPDSVNCGDLEIFVSEEHLKNVFIYQYALSNQPGQLNFDAKNNMESRISSSGNICVQVETIDHLVGDGPVTFINMDVEGFELAALKGAEKTILRCRPKLAISAYHKRDDIPAIYQYLKLLVPEYRFFFRNHKSISIDSVLYAIC